MAQLNRIHFFQAERLVAPLGARPDSHRDGQLLQGSRLMTVEFV
jgi:hypothetical protein